MSRKILLQKGDGTVDPLDERPVGCEEELRQLVKENPDILPYDELGLSGPLLVVGRETTLPSGAVDLVAIARGGQLLLIEFKTGPQNTEFRYSLAQLLDYGSDMWGMSYEGFEQTVALRYFAPQFPVQQRPSPRYTLRPVSTFHARG